MAFNFPAYALPAHDGVEDITDCWIEETDPENEEGQTCDGFFDDEVSGYGCHCAIVAIRVTGGWGIDYWSINLPRDMALKLLSPETVARIERLRAERLEDFS